MLNFTNEKERGRLIYEVMIGDLQSRCLRGQIICEYLQLCKVVYDMICLKERGRLLYEELFTMSMTKDLQS